MKRVYLQLFVLLVFTAICVFAQSGNPLVGAANALYSTALQIGSIIVGALVIYGALSAFGGGARGLVSVVGTVVGVIWAITHSTVIVNWVQSW